MLASRISALSVANSETASAYLPRDTGPRRWLTKHMCENLHVSDFRMKASELNERLLLATSVLGSNVRVWTPLQKQAVFERVWQRGRRCFRVSGLFVRPFITVTGLYGDRGSGPDRNRALEALGHSLVFPTPSSDRCAIPLVTFCLL